MAPSDDTVDHWKQPKWSQGFLWVRDAITHTLSVSYTEIAPLLPDVPASELANAAAVATITSHVHLFGIVTPIKTDCFEALLESHLNRLLIESICKGLCQGFWLYANVDGNAPTMWDNSSQLLTGNSLMFARQQ